MKRLLLILLVAAVIFIAIAMVQQWQVFATAWFGYQPEVPTLSEADRKDAENSLSLYLSLTSHLFRSNGDQRFLERIPAAQRVTDELMADILYLQHNGRYQEQKLERLEIEDVHLVAPGRVEISTREIWTIRTRSLEDNNETDPVLSGVSRARYRMSKEASGWIVQAWELDSSPVQPNREIAP